MSKSIETIWQTGFIDDMAQVAPQINDLYSMKSKNLIDKFKTMFAANQKGLLIGAMVIFGALTYFGAPVLGLLVALMVSGLVLIGQKQFRAMENIKSDESSFEYLRAFDTWLDDAMAQYTKIYRFFYPALFVMCAVRMAYSESAFKLFTQMQLLTESGHPSILVFAAISVIALLLSFAGGAIYRADVNQAYGKEIEKLKELIAEMQVLRGGE